MKNQALFSLKDKSEKLKCRLLQFLFGALRVNLFIGQFGRCFSDYDCSARKHAVSGMAEFIAFVNFCHSFPLSPKLSPNHMLKHAKETLETKTAITATQLSINMANYMQ